MQRLPPVLYRQAEAGRHRWPGRALRAPLRPEGQEVVTADRLDLVRGAKLRALVSDHWAKDAASPLVSSAFVGGAALLSSGRGEARGWVLIDDGSPRRFGPALAWARQAGVDRLDVLVEGSKAAGVVARRASLFAAPPVTVWLVDGRGVAPAVPAAVSVLAPSGAPPLLVVDLLRRHGCEAAVEHGVLIGSVLGLEVARVIDGELVVGVGRHDRIARASMRPGQDAGSALEEAAGAVRSWRRPGAARHPANTLQRSRWLRSVLCAQPALVGADWLEPAAPPLPSLGLTDNSAVPCVGGDVVAVCSVGVDLDLVPTAADCRLLHGPSSRLVIVTPVGDDVAVNRAVASGLADPVEFVTVPRQWEDLAATPASRP